MRKSITLFAISSILFSSCAEWKKAADDENKIEFSVEEGGGRKEKRRPKEEVVNNPNNGKTTAVSSSLLEKYAVQLGVDKKSLVFPELYAYIDGWIGVPYKYGGNTKEGVDCSGFVNAVYKDVFKTVLKRSATEIIGQCKEINKSELKESDLVFFDISGKNSHIGIYLQNNRFVHASTSKGVMISDLTQSYWQKAWGRAGRIL
ncbi:MAG: C40 family peptidase [Flavobacteriales bacterium]|nr:C40 family peptidase [Flavobacteriales bacterium]